MGTDIRAVRAQSMQTVAKGFTEYVNANRQTSDGTKINERKKSEKAENADSLELSENAKSSLSKGSSDKKNAQETAISELQRFAEELKTAQAQADEKGKEMSTISKCMKIAQRIMNGDNVPQKDMQYLAKNSPETLQKALVFRRPNPDPKNYKQVSEDEESIEEHGGDESTESLDETASADGAESATGAENSENTGGGESAAETTGGEAAVSVSVSEGAGE